MTASVPGHVTVLLADDDEGHVELIREHLADAGIANPIKRFKDGQEALDFFFGDGPDRYRPGGAYLLLLDIRMPRVDGIQVLHRLKSDPQLQRIPVIMLTTTDDPREIEQCYQLGCNCYVTKPVGFTALAETMQRLGLFLLIMQVAPTENR